jgi:hypothetical protein
LELQRLSIHQTYGQIGIETHIASQDIHSSSGELTIEQPSAIMDIKSPHGELQIDSSAAWAALGTGNHLDWMSSIYSQSKSVVLQSIAKIVRDGHRMSQITNHQNAFADLAKDVLERTNPIQYVSEASLFNVKLIYNPQAPVINIEPQKAEITYTPQKPDVQYHSGSVYIYLKQMNSIDIQVSQYDIYK